MENKILLNDFAHSNVFQVVMKGKHESSARFSDSRKAEYGVDFEGHDGTENGRDHDGKPHGTDHVLLRCLTAKKITH